MAGRLTKVHSAAVQGIDALEVEVEVNAAVAGDTSNIVIVGLPDAAVRESRDRVYTAILNTGYRRPFGRVTINLAPADVRKEGPSFDLPIALGMIALHEPIEDRRFEETCIVGELALDGRVRPVKGVLSLALEARARGRRAVFVPSANAAEAAVVDGITVYGIGHLREAVEVLRGESLLPPTELDRERFFASHSRYGIDFADVRGQAQVRRAAEVAVAGGHNLLLIGSPGTGKSMIAKRIATIMPPMSEVEAIESTQVHSIAGQLNGGRGFLATRPFRSPHHTISDVGLLGGGSNPGPGEVSLAHNGVLFLDELPEFRRSTLEVLRQPLEDGKVTISRAAGTMDFPSDFVLVAAMNPCPCGYAGDPKRECRCSPNQIQKYRAKISGPLLDRIDLHVEVPSVDYRELASGADGERSGAIRGRVAAARALQRERFAPVPGGVGGNGNGNGSGGGAGPGQRATICNAQMSPRQMREFCRLDERSHAMLEQVMGELGFSARAHDRVLKVARTLADLAGGGPISEDHVLEAVQYRSLDRNLWA